MRTCLKARLNPEKKFKEWSFTIPLISTYEHSPITSIHWT